MTESLQRPEGSIFRNAGYLTMALWVGTVLIALTMMWDKRWMESNPPSEILVGVLHAGAVAVGFTLGVSLLCAKFRADLTTPQMASFAAASILAAVSATRLL